MKSKTTLYLAGIIILIVLGVFFVSSNGYNGISTTGNTESNANSATGVQEITLSFKNGNYYPNTINVQPNKPVRIYLDSSVQGCYRSFTIRSFGVSKRLATPSDYVEFTPDKEGTFGFACSMGMGTGTLIVGNSNANIADTTLTGKAVNTPNYGGSCGSASGSCGCGS